jgi:hypothetical protein
MFTAFPNNALITGVGLIAVTVFFFKSTNAISMTLPISLFFSYAVASRQRLGISLKRDNVSAYSGLAT